MRWIRRLTVVVVAAYVAVCAFAFTQQRRWIYPAPRPAAPRVGGGLSLADVRYAGGTVPALIAEGAPVVAWFHGNGAQLATVVRTARSLAARGLGVAAFEYPGYGLATGAGPSEDTLLAAARAGLATLDAPPVCAGHSLGTGVAAAMAREGRCAALVLIAPYTSLYAAAGVATPLLPTRWLVLDRFDTLGGAAAVTVPTLVLHGARDTQIPVEMGRAVAAAIPGARLVERADRGHIDILDGETWGEIAGFAVGR